MHRDMARNQDIKLGDCLVSLSPLISLTAIDGWYHIQNQGLTIGQLKLSIIPLENVKRKL